MTTGSATISPCGRYRYDLTRSWDATLPELLVVMLNPSTADAAVDDPTIRRVMRFVRDWGYGELRVMNLYAFRASNPAALRQADYAVGPENDVRLTAALIAARDGKCVLDGGVLAAWGASQWAPHRAQRVMALAAGVRWMCLGTTKDGSPKHPLYVPASQRMIHYQHMPQVR